MHKMSFELTQPEPPPQSRFGRVLRRLLFFASLGAIALMTLRLAVPGALDGLH